MHGYSSEWHLCGLLAEPEWLASRSTEDRVTAGSFSFPAAIGRRRARPREGIATPLEGLAKPFSRRSGVTLS
jgi:hypothetical protein